MVSIERAARVAATALLAAVAMAAVASPALAGTTHRGHSSQHVSSSHSPKHPATHQHAVRPLAQILEQGYTPVVHASLADPFILLAWTAAGCAFAAWRFRWH